MIALWIVVPTLVLVAVYFAYAWWNSPATRWQTGRYDCCDVEGCENRTNPYHSHTDRGAGWV